MLVIPLTISQIENLPVGSVIGAKSDEAYCVALKVADIGKCWTITGLEDVFDTDYMIKVGIEHQWCYVGSYENES